MTQAHVQHSSVHVFDYLDPTLTVRRASNSPVPLLPIRRIKKMNCCAVLVDTPLFRDVSICRTRAAAHFVLGRNVTVNKIRGAFVHSGMSFPRVNRRGTH